jgi:hypothetical protein
VDGTDGLMAVPAFSLVCVAASAHTAISSTFHPDQADIYSNPSPACRDDGWLITAQLTFDNPHRPCRLSKSQLHDPCSCVLASQWLSQIEWTGALSDAVSQNLSIFGSLLGRWFSSWSAEVVSLAHLPGPRLHTSDQLSRSSPFHYAGGIVRVNRRS